MATNSDGTPNEEAFHRTDDDYRVNPADFGFEGTLISEYSVFERINGDWRLTHAIPTVGDLAVHKTISAADVSQEGKDSQPSSRNPQAGKFIPASYRVFPLDKPFLVKRRRQSQPDNIEGA